MIPDTVSNPRYLHGMQGTAWLLLDLDGVTVGIWEEQKLLAHGAAVLLPPPESAIDYEAHLAYTFILLPDNQDGRPEPQEFEGATSDPRVLMATRRYLNDLATGAWRPGPVRDLDL